jgi:hypothetical protein
VAVTADPRFDAAWVSATACATDPGLDPAVAVSLAQEAWEHLVAIGDLDAPELSRRLLGAHEGIGASETNAVATAAVAFCESADLLP